jgi:hypothetical protein
VFDRIFRPWMMRRNSDVSWLISGWPLIKVIQTKSTFFSLSRESEDGENAVDQTVKKDWLLAWLCMRILLLRLKSLEMAWVNLGLVGQGNSVKSVLVNDYYIFDLFKIKSSV